MEAYCSECGEALKVIEKNEMVYVIPCNTCMRIAKSHSFEDGYKDGYENGYDAGWDKGSRY